MYPKQKPQILWVWIIAIAKLITQLECSQMLSGFIPYPGFERYQVRIVVPTSPPFPFVLTNTLTLVSSWSNPFHVIAALNQISWHGMGKFSFDWNANGNTAVQIVMDSYPNTNTSYHYFGLFQVNVAIFDQTKYLYQTADFEFLQSNPTSILVNQVIQVTDYQFNKFGISIAFEEFYNQNTYFYSSIAMPSYSLMSTGGGMNTLTISTLASQGYNLRRIKFRLFNLSLILPQKLSSYYVLYSFYFNTLTSSMDINNNEAVCPSGHFYGISFLFGIRSVGTTVYGQAYVSNSANVSFLLFYFYQCLSRCPLSQPYKADLQCYSKCPSNYYLLPQVPGDYYRCETCTLPCLTCEGNNLNCTQCFSPYEVLSPYDPSSGLNRGCMCPKGQFGNPFPTCVFCNISIPYCALCTNTSYCLQCDFSLVYVPLTNTCECETGTSPIYKTISYDQNGIPITVTKMICISGTISESCNDLQIQSNALSINLVKFGQTCRCALGGSFISGQCV